MDRRDCLKLLASAVAFPHVAAYGRQTAHGSTNLTPSDVTFLDDMQRRGCLYFAEQVSATNGQVLDRAAAASSTGHRDPRPMASIAATGFGLTALCIADQRGYQPHVQILAQVRRTLRYHANTLPHVHGFFYHFNDIETGARFGGCELSPIDTALLLCGVLTARAYFNTDAEIVQLATTLYNRIDWPWMLNGGQTFAMGWSPEAGFQTGRWDHYCELMMMYLLAIGSPTHPIDASSWSAFTRPTLTYGGLTYIGGNDPLFPVQYSHAWFDFRNKRDAYANYFTNAVTATRAHEAWCIAQGVPYSQDYWGISASDSAHGYTAWGGPSITGGSYGGVDGSVVPYTTAGSLPFLPGDCVRVLRALKQNYPQSYGRYGFCDAMHPPANWYDPDVLGIDLGIGLVMSENARSSFVWNTFARNSEVALAMQKVGFRAVT